MLNAVEHARDEKDCERYKVEPYVMPGDVYSLAGHIGRGGWTWYTDATAWTYRVWLEEILGFQRRGDTLTIDPVIRKIGLVSVYDTVLRLLFVVSRSRIQTTVLEVSPWWKWMESRQPTRSSRCVTTCRLTKCVLFWELNHQREESSAPGRTFTAYWCVAAAIRPLIRPILVLKIVLE